MLEMTDLGRSEASHSPWPAALSCEMHPTALDLGLSNPAAWFDLVQIALFVALKHYHGNHM